MTPNTRGILLTLLASATAAGFLTTFKIAAALGPTADAVLVMLTVAALLNSAASGLQSIGRDLERIDRLSFGLAGALALLTLAGNHLAVEAVARISAPLTSVMQQTQVLIVAVLAWLLLGEAVTPRFWLGAGVALTGLTVLHVSPDAELELNSVGTALAGASAICWGSMAVLTRKYIHRIRAVAVNAIRLWMAVALWFLVHRRAPELGDASLSFVAYCAAAAFLGPFVSRMALMYALRDLRPSITTLIGLLTPGFTLVAAFFALGTVPTTREVVGGAVMLAGIAIPLLRLRAEPVEIPSPAE